MLCAQILDNVPDTSRPGYGGTLRSLPGGWGWWHVEVMTLTAVVEHHNITVEALDALPGDEQYALEKATPLYRTGYHVVQGDWSWHDPADDEVLHLPPGTVLHIFSR